MRDTFLEFNPHMLDPDFQAQDRSRVLLDVTIIFAVLEVVFYTLYLVVRITKKTANGLDFYIMPFAFLMSFVHIPIMIVIVQNGTGRHWVVLEHHEIVTAAKLIFAEELIYIVSVTLPKLAILALYLRLFATGHYRYYRYAVYGIGIAMVLNVLVTFVLALTVCKPIAYHWDISIKGGYCVGRMTMFRYISLPNIITDVAMLVLPLPTIWKLRTGLTEKIGLTATFLTGSISLAISILRFRSFFVSDLFADPPYNSVDALVWTCAEPGCYFIVATLPSLAPMIRHLFSNLKLTSVMSSGKPLNEPLRTASGLEKTIDSSQQSRKNGMQDETSESTIENGSIYMETNFSVTHEPAED